MIALGVLVVLALPVAALVTVLKAADAVQRRRAEVVTRQIEVTDAIHREFGAIVAPTVHRARGGWRVVLPIDPRHPDTARVVELAALTLAGVRPVEVALVAPAPRRPASAAEKDPAHLRRAQQLRRRPVDDRASALQHVAARGD